MPSTLDTDTGTQIIPNAKLADSAFTNLSEPAGLHPVTITTTFGSDDRPEVVRRLLDGIARDLPLLHPDSTPRTDLIAPKTYQTTMAVRSPSDADDVTAVFQRWTWYAARRAGPHLDAGTASFSQADDIEAALRRVGPTLRLDQHDISVAAQAVQLEIWAIGERALRAGSIPDGIRFVLAGQLEREVPTPRGAIPVQTLRADDFFGQNALLREPVVTDVVVTEEATTLYVPIHLIDQLIRAHPALARGLGQAVDVRREQIISALREHRTTAGVLLPDNSR